MRDTADILRRASTSMGEKTFAMRGQEDEFVLISHQDLIPRIEEELRLFVSSVRQSYDLSLTMSSHKVTAGDGLTLEQAIQQVK